MMKLQGSVGWNGRNNKQDVLLVQTQLSRSHLSSSLSLQPNGICGPSTLSAIKEFQRRQLHIPQPDGLISPGGPTWRLLSGRASGIGAINAKSAASARVLAGEPSIRAMLEVIGYSEGTKNEYGMVVHGTVIKAPNPKDVGRRNVIVTDFSDHPNMLVQVNASLKSTAAGRYQFLVGTWRELGLADFTPASQDIAAVMLFQRRRMVLPLLKGDFQTAVQRGSLEWASLPDSKKGGASHYGGQPARTYPQLKLKYDEALAKCAKAKNMVC